MRKIIFLICAFLLSYVTLNEATAQENNKAYFFYGTGCPHCSKTEKYLSENNLTDKYQIEIKEIYFNKENAKFYNDLLNKLGVPIEKRGVPTLVSGNDVVIGDIPIINYFELKERETEETPFQEESVIPKEEKTNLTVLAVIAASIVDAVNPCAFAVLIILMTTVLASENTKKALKSGLSFSLSIFISYLLMGLGLYKALSLSAINSSTLFFQVVGYLAIILGLLNLKDFFWYGKGVLMEVPLSWRPKLKNLIKSITSPLGAFSVGFLVSLFLLPCTSGPYIVILGMLSQKALFTQAFFYLIIYNLIFVSPMIFITIAVSKGFDPSKAEEIRQKRLRLLHLIAGIILLIMGVAILNYWI